MNDLNNIKRYFKVIDASLFTICGKLDYDRVTDAIIKLADAVHNFDISDDGYEIWNIGEFGECSLDDLIIGSHWHYAEWHGGQWSKGYAALSALGKVFAPGMTSTDPDNAAYQALNAMAEH